MLFKDARAGAPVPPIMRRLTATCLLDRRSSLRRSLAT